MSVYIYIYIYICNFHFTGNHMYLTAHINGELVIRPYTPVTSNDEIGYFDLVIKVWSKLLHILTLL